MACRDCFRLIPWPDDQDTLCDECARKKTMNTRYAVTVDGQYVAYHDLDSVFLTPAQKDAHRFEHEADAWQCALNMMFVNKTLGKSADVLVEPLP